MTDVLVSVIVATYRRDESLKRALETIQSQTYSNVEIIVIDDNDDKAWNSCVSSIVKNFTNLTYIQNHSNMGSAQTRNIGIKAAHGQFITFLDDDDEYLPKKIEKQVKYMQNNMLDYCLANLDLYYENGVLCEHRNRNYIKKTDTESLIAYHLMYHMTGTDVMMFRKEYLEKIGGFDPINVGDEFYLMQKAILAGGKFGYLNSYDVKAYVHTREGGVSSGNGKIDGENTLFQYKKQFFSQIGKRSIRFIYMRHYAVLAFAYVRMKKIFPFLVNGVRSFFCSPINCIKMLIDMKHS